MVVVIIALEEYCGSEYVGVQRLVVGIHESLGLEARLMAYCIEIEGSARHKQSVSLRIVERQCFHWPFPISYFIWAI